MIKLNKVNKFIYHYNCCYHIIIKEKVHVKIKTNNYFVQPYMKLQVNQKFCKMFSDCLIKSIIFVHAISLNFSILHLVSIHRLLLYPEKHDHRHSDLQIVSFLSESKIYTIKNKARTCTRPMRFTFRISYYIKKIST